MPESQPYFLSRQIANHLQQLQQLLQQSSVCVFLSGPRQSGKTTFCRQLSRRLEGSQTVWWLDFDSQLNASISAQYPAVCPRVEPNWAKLLEQRLAPQETAIVVMDGLEQACQQELLQVWQQLPSPKMLSLVILRQDEASLSLQQQARDCGWQQVVPVSLPALSPADAWSLLQQSCVRDETLQRLDPACKKHLPNAPLWPAVVLDKVVLCQSRVQAQVPDQDKHSAEMVAGVLVLMMLMAGAIWWFELKSSTQLAGTSPEPKHLETAVIEPEPESDEELQTLLPEIQIPTATEQEQLPTSQVSVDKLETPPVQPFEPVDSLWQLAQSSAQQWLANADKSQATLQFSSAVISAAALKQEQPEALEKELADLQNQSAQSPLMAFSQIKGERAVVTLCAGQFESLAQAKTLALQLSSEDSRLKPIARTAGGLRKQLR